MIWGTAIWSPATGTTRNKEEEMGRFKEIIIEAAAPYERGVQHGQAARDLIERGIARYQEHFLKSEQAPSPNF